MYRKNKNKRTFLSIENDSSGARYGSIQNII